MTQWALQDAKNRFSAVVDAALGGEPQTVTRRGVPAVVVLAADEYQSLCQSERAAAPDFVEHLLAIPRGGPEEDGDDLFERPSLELRDVEW